MVFYPGPPPVRNKIEGVIPAGGYYRTIYPLTCSGTDAGGVQPSPLITRLRPQEGSESGQLSARGFEPTQTPTAACQADILTIVLNPRQPTPKVTPNMLFYPEFLNHNLDFYQTNKPISVMKVVSGINHATPKC